MNIELIQEVLTYSIVGGAFYVAGYKILTALVGKKAGNDNCGTGCSDCSAIDLKKNAHSTRIIKE